MKVLHVVSEPGPAGGGVSQKVVRTVETWRRLGLEADFIDLATGRTGRSGIAAGDPFRPRLRGEWILEMDRRARRLRRTLEEVAPDLVYTRELIWSPGLKSILERFPVVIEVNSDRGEELRSHARAASAFWNLTAPWIRRRAAGQVFVTNELARRLGSPKVPATVVGNGVDVPLSPPTRRPCSERPLVVMLVGGAAPWHGIDRFAGLARQMPQFDFAICGDVGREFGGLPETLRLLEPRVGSELDELLSKTSVSFGTLALSRKNMTEACPLKSRTSLAAGVPLVYAYEDPALRGDEPFALRIEDRDRQSPAAVARIVKFIDAATAEPALGIEAWKFARRKLDVDVVERDRLEFFSSVLGDSPADRRPSRSMSKRV